MEKYSKGKDYKVIAYCISRFHRDEQRDNIYYFCRLCERYNYKVMIFSTLTDLYYDDLNDHGEKQIYSVFDVTAFDAVVIMSETFKKIRIDREIADRAIKAGIPVVSVNRRLEGCINVDFSYTETFEKIVRHIVEDHGCRRVNYIGGDRNSKFSKERFESYKKVLADNNIPFEEARTGYGNFVSKTAVEVLNGFLKTGELPDAVVCANDTMALAVCSRLKELGIRVPEDIRVTGFDGIEFEKYHNPRITTGAYNWEKTAWVICEAVRKALEKDHVEPLIIVPYNFQPGHSCGCKENYVLSATDRLLEFEALRGSSEEYFQTMMNMDAEANNCEEFEELLRVAESFSQAIHYKEFWICLNTFCWEKMSNRIPEDMEELLNQARYGEEQVYSERVVMVSHYKPEGEAGERNIIEIDRKELIPDLNALLERENRVMFLPLHLQGITIGYIAVTFDNRETRLDLLNIFIMNFRSDIENFWSRIIKEQLFSRDELTGLYNRRGFQKQKQKLFGAGQCQDNFTLISMDMDNLKKINDRYGHGEGDVALRQIGKIIENSAEKGEICARMGGDEFLIATTNEKGKDRAIEIENAIHKKLEEYNLTSGKPYELWASIGYYTGEKVEQIDYENFASQADKEMYQDKLRHKKAEL